MIARAGRIRWLRRSGWLHARDGPCAAAVPADRRRAGRAQLAGRQAERLPPRADAARRADRVPLHPPGGLVLAGAADRRDADSRWARGRVGHRVRRPPCGSCSTTAPPARSTASCSAPASRSAPTAIRCWGPELSADLRTRDGAPLLAAGFESSVAGLHFVGAFAAASFGPVMRFVSGTPFTGRALGAHVRDARPPTLVRTRPASAPRLRRCGPGPLVTGASYRALGGRAQPGPARRAVRVVRSDEHALAHASRYVSGRLSWPAAGDGAAASSTCSISPSASACTAGS